MKYLKFVILSFLFLFLFVPKNVISSKNILNNKSLIYQNDKLKGLGFKSQCEWDEFRNDNFPSPYFEVSNLGVQNFDYQIYPYWHGFLFKDKKIYNFNRIRRIGYFAYMLNYRNGDTKQIYAWITRNIVEEAIQFGCKLDLVLFCEGEKETSKFIKSKSARKLCVNNIYKLACERTTFEPNLHNADGINIYFPDYNFRNKRYFKSFITELYRKLQFLNTNNNNTEIILTFPTSKYSLKNYKFISKISKYVDMLYFADFNYMGKIIGDYYFQSFKEDADIRFVSSEMDVDSIKFAKEVPIIKHKNEISINKGDYFRYLIILLIIFVLILGTFIIINIKNTAYSNFIEQNPTVVPILIFNVCLEIFFLTIFKIDNLNFGLWIFDSKNSSNIMILFLPIYFFIIYIIFLILKKKDPLS